MSDNKKAADAAASASLQEEMDAVMRKYDRESATRIWAGKPKIVISVVMALFSIYCIWSTLFSTAALEIRLTAFLGLIVIMGYLTYPASKKHVHANRLPWYDIVIMVIGAAAFFYYCFNYSVLIKTLTSAAKMTPFLIAVGVAGILVLAELCRRCVGLPILVVVGALLVYTFVSMLNAGQTFQQVLSRVIYTLFFGTSGVLSTPVQVCAKFIAVFIIFGGFLERTGIASFFIDAGQRHRRLDLRRPGQGRRHLVRAVRHGVRLLRRQHRHHRLGHHPDDEKDRLQAGVRRRRRGGGLHRRPDHAAHHGRGRVPHGRVHGRHLWSGHTLGHPARRAVLRRHLHRRASRGQEARPQGHPALGAAPLQATSSATSICCCRSCS